MNILFVAPTPPPVTGQSLACELLFSSLKSKATVNAVNLSKQTFRQGINSIQRVSAVLKIIVQVWMGKNNSDVIYFTVSESVAGNLKDLMIYAACWRRLNRMVIHLHGGAGMRKIIWGKNSLLRRINIYFLRRLGAVIVLGDRLRSIYDGVVPSARLHAVPNFAKDEFFVTSSDIDKKFAHIQPLRILFLSNLLPGKGYKELLIALAQLPLNDRIRLHVDFAGGFESYEDEIRFRKQVENINNIQITVHGVVHGEHKRDLLRKAHLFCLPTYYPYEGQPISILEAFASGCAVITTDHSGIFDIFHPGRNGYEVKPKEPATISEAIKKSLNDPEKLHEFACNNLRDAQHKYRASKHLAALEDVIFSFADFHK